MLVQQAILNTNASLNVPAFTLDLEFALGSLGPTPGNLGELPSQALDEYPLAAQQYINSTAYPWSTVVSVSAHFSDGTSEFGSGVIVGRNDVLTAAHMVYSSAHGGLATSVTVTPDFNPASGGGPYGSYSASITHYDTQVDPDGDGFAPPGNGGAGLVGSERDLAFLTLATPLGDQTGWMGLDPGFQQGNLNETGYPGVYGNRMTNDQAYAYNDQVDQYIHLNNFEAHLGNSGGPLWHYGGDGLPYVVGLISSASAAVEVAPYFDSISTWLHSNDNLIA